MKCNCGTDKCSGYFGITKKTYLNLKVNDLNNLKQ